MFQQFTQSRSLAFLSAIFVLLMFFGCGTDENIFKPEVKATPGAYNSVEEVMATIKARGDVISPEIQPSDILMAPSSGEWETSKKVNVQNEWDAVVLEVPNVRNVRFKVKKKALPKPTTISIKLSLTVIQNDAGTDELGAMQFELGPSGTQFNPPAELKIPFQMLLTDALDTFLITDENGDEVDGCSYDIDEENEYLITYIPHFSKYYYNRG